MRPQGLAPAISATESEANRPFWSVMIPTYNPSASYLAETLGAVLAQDPGVAQMQIEVIDDCSPVGPPLGIVEQIAGARVTLFAESKNLGLAGIWNRCLERARGQWIHILHQDDLIYPGFYEVMRAGIEVHLDAGAAFCRHAFCDGEGHWRRLSDLEQSRSGLLPNFVEALVNGHRVQCASIVVKRSTYESLGGFRPELEHALDWEMWIRIAQSFPVFYEPKILAAWRVHPRAETTRQRRTGENIRDIVKAIGIWRAYLPQEKSAILARLALKRFANEAFEGARYFSALGDFKASRNQISAALDCDRSFASRQRAARIWTKAMARMLLRTTRSSR